MWFSPPPCSTKSPSILYYKNVQRANVQDYGIHMYSVQTYSCNRKSQKTSHISRTMQLPRQPYNSSPSCLVHSTPIIDFPIYATWRRSPKDTTIQPTSTYCCRYYPILPEPADGDSNYITVTATTSQYYKNDENEDLRTK